MPVPRPNHGAARIAKARLWRIFRLLALLAFLIAGIALLLVVRGDPAPLAHIHMLIATALGVGVTVLLGTGLMTMAFVSNSSGHDEIAANFQDESEQ